jgi:hypothetical protein
MIYRTTKNQFIFPRYFIILRLALFLILFFSSVINGFCAVANTNAQYTYAPGTVTGNYVTISNFNVPVGSNHILVIIQYSADDIYVEDPGISSVTWGGTALSHITSQQDVTLITAFYSAIVSPGTNDLSLFVDGGTPGSSLTLEFAGYANSGVSATAPLGTAVKANGTAQLPQLQ